MPTLNIVTGTYMLINSHILYTELIESFTPSFVSFDMGSMTHRTREQKPNMALCNLDGGVSFIKVC